MDLLMKKIVLLFVVMAIFFPGSCNASSVYNVGDDVGWSVMGHVDFIEWASSKNFQIGDTLVFKYNQDFHNVLQVSESDFHSCNTASPISTYTTGNDSIVINNSGHYYYMCGFAHHCEAGQKVDIKVSKSVQASSGPVSSPVQALKPLSNKPMTQHPSSSSGESLLFKTGLFSCVVGLLVIVFWAIV